MTARPSVRESTNVRFPWERTRLRAAFEAFGRFAPPLASRVAERMFFTPTRQAASPDQTSFLGTGRRIDLAVDGQRMAAWEWGHGQPVLLVHGWAGRGGQLRAFVPPLVNAGYRAVTFDVPGHGDSEGRRSSLLVFARAIERMAAEYGPFAGVVAHSLGAAATALAHSRGVEMERAVLLGPMADPYGYFRRFLESLGLSEGVCDATERRIERKLDFSWDTFHVPTLAATFEIPALVFHDRADAEVPFGHGAAITAAWPDAVLHPTTGLGHRRILRAPEVLGRAIPFLTEPSTRLLAASC